MLSLFVQGARVQNILEDRIADRGHACFHEVTVSQNFGTRICGPPTRLLLRFVRVPKSWDTEFEPFPFEQNDAYQDATVAEILPASGRPWDRRWHQRQSRVVKRCGSLRPVPPPHWAHDGVANPLSGGRVSQDGERPCTGGARAMCGPPPTRPHT